MPEDQNHEKIVTRTYDRLAGSYEHRWKSYVWSTLEHLRDRLPLKGREEILDVACGTGILEELLIQRWPDLKIAAVDVSEKMLARAHHRLKPYPIVLKQGSVSRLPFGENQFDMVVCANAFHYFNHAGRAISEMKRVLKKGGHLIILDWCRDYLACRICDIFLKFFDPAYRQCYSLRELENLLLNNLLSVSGKMKFRFGIIWGMAFLDSIKE